MEYIIFIFYSLRLYIVFLLFYSSLLISSVLAGKLAAEVVSERAANLPYSGSVKAIEPSIVEKALQSKPKDPVGVLGEGAIAFGVYILNIGPMLCMYVCMRYVLYINRVAR